MKLPFTLGIKFVYRILLPGFVLALGLLPVSRTALDFNNSVISLEYVFILEMLLLGWLFVLLDMPVYMAFEGRRWPGPLRRLFTSVEQRRLDGIMKEVESDDIQRSREASVEARRFPLDDKTGRPVAKFPTRLGNLLTAFEEYLDEDLRHAAVFLLAAPLGEARQGLARGD